MKRLYFVSIFIFNFLLYGWSQDNSIFFHRKVLVDTNVNKLFFRFESNSFLKNNEYFDTVITNKIVGSIPGWTGIGFMLQPRFVYQPTEKTSIELGYFLEKFSGRQELYKPMPLFRVRQLLLDSLELVFGQLYGNLEYNLNEPMYRIDRLYTDNIEYGIQFLYNRKFIDNDLWLSWDKFIFYNDPNKEELFIGENVRLKLNITHKIRLELPFHLTWTHAGGQIDNQEGERGGAMSLINTMSGLKLKYNFNEKYLSCIGLEGLYYGYKAGSNPQVGEKNHQLLDKGYGQYLGIMIDFHDFKISSGYWRGHNYVARKGEYIYQSVYEYINERTDPDRDVYTTHLTYDYKIRPNIVFSLRSDLYYSLDRNQFDYSYGFYFIYNDDFLLKRIGRKY